jgi:cysteinyl-tRNA synthetase
VMLSTHYSKPMDWTEKKREEAEKTLRKWRKLTEGAERSRRPHLEVVDALSDDLNTPLAISVLHAKAREVKSKEDANRFLGTLALLGLGSGWRDGVRVAVENAFEVSGILDRLTAEIERARSERDYETSDRIRDALTEAGVIVQISKDGVSREIGPDFDPAKLEALR